MSNKKKDKTIEVIDTATLDAGSLRINIDHFKELIKWVKVIAVSLIIIVEMFVLFVIL